MSALQGLRVLDISSGIAGPFCARLLADAGADVIKIEDPRGGDATRRENPIFADHRLEDISALFIYLNQNKRGVSLNIESVTGREILKQMAEKSDVVVESFAPGTLERLGVSHGELRRIRPGIVLISITDFGQTGPYRDYKATHLTLSALGGWQQGEATREPIQAGFPVLYYMAGLWGAIGALAALRGSHQDEGQHVDISVMDVCLNANTPTKVRELFGLSWKREGQRWVGGGEQPNSPALARRACLDGHGGRARRRRAFLQCTQEGADPAGTGSARQRMGEGQDAV